MFRARSAFTALLVVTAVAGAACSSGSGTGSGHPSTPVAAASSAPASATATPAGLPQPRAITGAFGVLAGPFPGNDYDVTLVGVDGKVAAAAQATAPATPACPRVGVATVPDPVSTSDSAAYYMDAGGVVRWVSPSGSTSVAPVVTLPIGATTRSVFAVSPDDSRMAVAVIDFLPNGATTRLFVDDLRGGAHALIFSETGQYTLWPIGWHTGYLVVAKVAACTNGIGPIWSDQTELHVVDPATAARKYTLGGPACRILGPASAGGVICQSGTQAVELDWTATSFGRFASAGTETFLSPDAKTVAIISDYATNLGYTLINGMQACEFIDNSHLLSGGDAQSQPKVAVPNGSITPVNATGDCAGRIPGAL